MRDRRPDGEAQVTTTRMDGTARRAQIRRVAAELFDANGYRETSMDAIADAVGIKKASVYYYFPSKDQLLVELHEEMIELIISAQEERVGAADHTPQRMLLAIMTDLVTLQETHPGHLKIFFEHYRELPEPVRTTIAAKREHYRQLLIQVLRNGIECGDFAALDPEFTAMAVLGMCNWTYQWFRPGGTLTAAQVAERFWSLLQQGIAPA
jgi:AcrR family transcriptional regulator